MVLFNFIDHFIASFHRPLRIAAGLVPPTLFKNQQDHHHTIRHRHHHLRDDGHPKSLSGFGQANENPRPFMILYSAVDVLETC